MQILGKANVFYARNLLKLFDYAPEHEVMLRKAITARFDQNRRARFKSI